MSSWLRTFTLSMVLGASLAVMGPGSAKADDYWNGYWSWYDNSYRPYYYRQYYSPGDYYGGGYGGYSGYGGYNYSYPQARYYGGPNAGYGNYGRRGGTIQVGPMRFGWR